VKQEKQQKFKKKEKKDENRLSILLQLIKGNLINLFDQNVSFSPNFLLDI